MPTNSLSPSEYKITKREPSLFEEEPFILSANRLVIFFYSSIKTFSKYSALPLSIIALIDFLITLSSNPEN